MADTRISVVAGFCAGIAEILIGHPFDTIKTRIQTQSQDRVGDKILYRGPLHCAVTIIRREGLAGLYKGLAAPLIQNALGVALLFGAMDWLRGVLGASIFAPHRFVLACFLIGTVESVLYCPFDHIKARLQVGAAKRGRRGGVSVNTGKNAAEVHVSNAMQVMREVIAVKGPLGLYYGWIFQWLKETTGNVALFGVYDIVMLLLGEPGAGRGGSRHAHPEGLHWMHIWPAGSLAGMAYFAVGYPFDTVKSRLQTDSLTSPRFKGPLHAVMRILQDEGSILELYRGLSVCLIRAIPGSAAQFVVFEVIYSLLSAMATIHQTIGPHMANMDHFTGLDHF